MYKFVVVGCVIFLGIFAFYSMDDSNKTSVRNIFVNNYLTTKPIYSVWPEFESIPAIKHVSSKVMFIFWFTPFKTTK